MNRRHLRWLLSLAAVAVTGVLSLVLSATAPQAKSQPADTFLPAVQVHTVYTQTVSIPVQTRGLVAPQTQVSLMSEVAGHLTEVSAQLRSGGFFKNGDLLGRIDPIRYELDINK
ncbi:MAG: hypothetical protein LPK85_04180 [Gammaproteobacteria bacterium]|nr:hypothetical protein [Gammaproteobacteria bacterium]